MRRPSVCFTVDIVGRDVMLLWSVLLWLWLQGPLPGMFYCGYCYDVSPLLYAGCFTCLEKAFELCIDALPQKSLARAVQAEFMQFLCLGFYFELCLLTLVAACTCCEN